MIDRLALSLLGAPEINKADRPVTGFTSKKVFALLCYLAVSGQTHLRPTLAGLLWGELPEAAAQNNLRKALSNLRRVAGPYVHITRQAVAFKTDSPFWLDVLEFESALEAPGPHSDLDRLESAIELYRGDFLDGFYVRDAPEFEHWVLIQRVRLREIAIRTLQTLTWQRARLGREHFPVAIEYARRCLEMDPFQEEAHRHLMRLLALDGQRTAALAQYKTCCQILSEELQVGPGPDTKRLFVQIQENQVEPIPALPGFLIRESGVEDLPPFFGREPELSLLADSLQESRSGQGKVIFIAGGPGRGKTALLNAFVRRALTLQPDLLVAAGKSSAYWGVGDPFAPFREVLGMLTGDVEAQWAAGRISQEHARRLWQAMPLSAQAILYRGPQLLNTFLDGRALCHRLAVEGSPVLSEVRGQLRNQGNQRVSDPAFTPPVDLIGQVCRALDLLSQQRPILIILDDFQWMDIASAGLFFHLGRQLAGQRLMVASAYRPEEIKMEEQLSDSERERILHLDKIVSEFRLQFGDTWIDLAQSDVREGRAFVNACIDGEPNRLDPDFREALFSRSAGHPLFTIELLRMLQRDGNLLRGSDGAWVVSSPPEWGKIPDKVESVIEHRIEMLDKKAQAVLAVASVEGEVFSAPVIANVLGMDEMEVLGLLSRLLCRQYRLVSPYQDDHSGDSHYSRFQFSHVLYRDYAYRRINSGERRILHHKVGMALEEGFRDRTEEIAVRLAHHFVGELNKEQRYCRIAGEQCVRKFAHEEARTYLSRALELTPDSDLSERFHLLKLREQVLDFSGDRQSQQLDLIALAEAAKGLNDPQKLAFAALRSAHFDWSSGDNITAIEKCKQAKDFLSSSANREFEAYILRLWGLSLSRLGDTDGATKIFLRAVSIARKSGARWLEAETLRHVGNIFVLADKQDLAAEYYSQALPILQEVGDRSDEVRVLHSMAILYHLQFEYQKAKDHWVRALEICREIGSQFYGNIMEFSLAGVIQDFGFYADARERYKEVLKTSLDLGDRCSESRCLAGIGLTSYYLGEDQEALEAFQSALCVAQEIQEKYVEAHIHAALGQVYAGCDQYGPAADHYRKSVELNRKIGHKNAAFKPLAGLALMNLDKGDPARALRLVEDILEKIEEDGSYGCDLPLFIYLACYKILQAHRDVRAGALLVTAFNLLHLRAAGIKEDGDRASFLENVRINREIQHAWAAVSGAVDLQPIQKRGLVTQKS